MDPYQTLGIDRTADQTEIKKSFRKLARQYHPDVNPDSEEKFKEIQAAYALLSDPEKKQQYDTGTGEFAQGMNPDMFRFEDLPLDQLFNEVFAGDLNNIFTNFKRRQPRQKNNSKIKMRLPAQVQAGALLTAKTANGQQIQFRLPEKAQVGTIIRLAGKGEGGGSLYIELVD